MAALRDTSPSCEARGWRDQKVTHTANAVIVVRDSTSSPHRTGGRGVKEGGEEDFAGGR